MDMFATFCENVERHLKLYSEEKNEKKPDWIDLAVLKGKLKMVFAVIGREYEQVHNQHSDSLAIAAMLYSAIKVGMSSGLFNKSVASLSKRKKMSVKDVKEGESYALVKKILDNAKETTA